MRSRITRRDFLNGTALTIAAGLAPIDQLQAQGLRPRARTGPYPPALAGMRGSTDASFKVIHALALEGQRFDIDKLVPEESYDLVVIGAGLAGLTAAWSYRERLPRARILILDNNDDFGGQARRTEHTIGGRTYLSYGGSESLVAPSLKFKDELGRILKSLRIFPERFEQESVFHRKLYPGLGLSKSVFFDKKAFGRDALVTGDPLVLSYDEYLPDNPGARTWQAFLADCPLSDAASAGLLELIEGRRDYLSNMTPEQKTERLEKLSYRAFLTEVVKLPKDACDLLQGRSLDNWGFGLDALGTLEMLADGYPGAKALKLEDKAGGHEEESQPYVHHFPDGNASIARLLVRAMIRGVARGVSVGPAMDTIVSASFDYSRLDRPGQPVRIRLESTAVVVRNAATGGGVDVGYVKDGELRRVKAGQAVVATYMAAIPHLVPEVDKEAAELMRANVKAPLIYSKVAVRSWESFVRLRTHRISAPMSFHSTVKLDYPVSLGGYRFESNPAKPAMLHLVHVPAEPGKGLSARDQARAGRARLMGMPFADFETAIRADLARMLGPGGFDGARDILGLTVNRWSHGYSYTPSSLYDEVGEALSKKQEDIKAKLGNIAFANSDTGWDAYAHTAMAEAVRAVGELTGVPPPDYRPRWYERFLERVRRKPGADGKEPEKAKPETK